MELFCSDCLRRTKGKKSPSLQIKLENLVECLYETKTQGGEHYSLIKAGRSTNAGKEDTFSNFVGTEIQTRSKRKTESQIIKASRTDLYGIIICVMTEI